MTVDELRRKSDMELRELAFKKVSAAMRPWMRRRHRLPRGCSQLPGVEQRGWAGVPHRPSLRELRESEEM